MRYRGGNYPETGYQETGYQENGNQQFGNQQFGNQQFGNQGTDYQENVNPQIGYQENGNQQVNEAQQLLNIVRQKLQRTSYNNNLINDIQQIIRQLTVSNIGKVWNYIEQLEQFKYSSQYNESQLSKIQTIINNIKANLNSNSGLFGLGTSYL
jgi:NifB/MoaA-like Fe-S oxidoreductase